MAGAMVGLADSYIGSIENPAGLAMTADSTGLQFTGNSIHDGDIQTYPTTINANSGVAMANFYPWGFGVASWSPQSEGDLYAIPAASSAPFANLSTRTRETRLSVARLFLDDRLSVGVSLVYGQKTEDFQALDANHGAGQLYESNIGAWGAGIGVLYQLPNRVLLGAELTLPMNYSLDRAQASAPPGVADFFQDAHAPFRLGAGAGWIPNRLFRVSAGLYVYGPTQGTALLSNDSRLVGETVTLQPRLGISYLLAEYRELKVDLALGSYLEVFRVNDVFSRLHGTVALEIKPWIFDFGWGLDEARYYENFIYTAGIDVGRVLQKLDLIPRPRAYATAGLVPNPTRLSEEGLPRAMNSSYRDEPTKNAFEVGREIPGKLRDRIQTAPGDIRNLGKEILDSVESLPGDIRDEVRQSAPLVAQAGEGGLDYSLGFGMRSLPVGASVLARVGYGELLWGTKDAGSVLYGYLRPSLQASTSAVVNRVDLGLDVFPVSFAGARLGWAGSMRLGDLSGIDCQAVLCRGYVSGPYLQSVLLLGSGPVFAAGAARIAWLTPSDLSRPFAEEQSSLVAASAGDSQVSLDLALGAHLGPEWSAGLYLNTERMIGSTSSSDHQSVFARLRRGSWAYTAGAGLFESNAQARSPTVYGAIEWTGLASIGLE